MDFYSAKARQRYTISPAGVKIVTDAHGRDIAITKKSKRIEFEPVGSPFYTTLLASKDGMAHGYLNTAYAASQTGLDETFLINWLIEHRDHGTKFVGVGVDGKELVSEEAYIKPEGERGYFCILCSKHLQNVQGMKNHVKSSSHTDAVELKKLEALEALNH